MLTFGRFRWLPKGINIPSAIPVPVLIENIFTNFKYSSFSRRYHAYKDVWISNYCIWLLRRIQWKWLECHCNYMKWQCFKNVVGHVPLNWSKVASKLLQFTNRGDWKESQSWCWNVTRNTCKLIFYDDAIDIT